MSAFAFKQGKPYMARVVLTGLQKLASTDTVARKATEALGMQVTARKLSVAGEFILEGRWTKPDQIVPLPPMVKGVSEL